MIAALRKPVRRVSFAIALSAVIHAVVLWLPHLQPPHEEVHLPPLTARLELLPKTATHPTTKPAPATQTGKPEGSTINKSNVGTPSKPDGSTPHKPGNIPPVNPTSNTAETMKQMEKSAASHQFPKHLQLSFTVYKGSDGSQVGELHQQLDIVSDSYTLKSTKQITGLASLLNSDQLIRTSQGKIDEHGLQPETFKEEKISGNSKQDLEATFDRKTQKLLFSNGSDVALPADAQDILSFTYQLSQLSMQREIIPLSISNGMQLEQVQIEIGVTEDISTPMGNLRAMHLRKMHAQGEAYFEIWLSKEYRLLPVKFRQINRSDKVIEEYVISDIRASDD